MSIQGLIFFIIIIIISFCNTWSCPHRFSKTIAPMILVGLLLIGFILLNIPANLHFSAHIPGRFLLQSWWNMKNCNYYILLVLRIPGKKVSENSYRIPVRLSQDWFVQVYIDFFYSDHIWLWISIKLTHFYSDHIWLRIFIKLTNFSSVVDYLNI